MDNPKITVIDSGERCVRVAVLEDLPAKLSKMFWYDGSESQRNARLEACAYAKNVSKNYRVRWETNF